MRESEILFDKLIGPIENKMIGIIWRTIRDPEDYKDVFQTVLEQVWSKLERINQHPNPQAYILRICVTRSYDTLRRKTLRRRYEVLFDGIKSKILRIHPLAFINTRDRELTLHEAISMLPKNQGKAVLLHSMGDVSFDLIGNILGCSEATARSHFTKGKSRLRNILSEMGMSS